MNALSRRRFLKASADGSLMAAAGIRPVLAADEVLKVGVIHMAPFPTPAGSTSRPRPAVAEWRPMATRSDVTVSRTSGRSRIASACSARWRDPGPQAAVRDHLLPVRLAEEACPVVAAGSLRVLRRHRGRQQPRCLRSQALRGNLPHRHRRRPDDQDERARLGRRLPVPQVIYSLNAFLLGARSVQPGRRAQGGLGQRWGRSRQGKGCRAPLVAQGADVLSGSPNTRCAGVSPPEEKGVWFVRQHGRLLGLCEEAQLCSFENSTGAPRISRRRRASWTAPGRRPAVGAASATALREDDHQQPGSARAGRRRDEGRRGPAIIAGTLHPFTGPDQGPGRHGGHRSRYDPARRHAQGMNWLVEGVQGTLPSAG